MSDTGRTAILKAARRAFALRPYANVTLRSIASDAGVSAALIVKHFGGKDQLFEAVADFTSDADLLFDAPRAELGRHMVETLLVTRRASNSSPLVRVIFGIGAGDERALLLDRFREQVTTRLEKLLDGHDPRLRAELILSQFLGMSATISIHPGGRTTTADVSRIVDLYAPAIQALVDG
ncbi:TetR/AcrR family transcriptional regulator [Actinocorallia longicatena]|uniref:TetR family transcriptional regulator n=1 Tax=Actinocorallia longicatena TaxID=111803 RepID=A0ABP6QM17_9ACTN